MTDIVVTCGKVLVYLILCFGHYFLLECVEHLICQYRSGKVSTFIIITYFRRLLRFVYYVGDFIVYDILDDRLGCLAFRRTLDCDYYFSRFSHTL